MADYEEADTGYEATEEEDAEEETTAEEGTVEEEVKEPDDPPVTMDEEMMKQSLSLLCKTGDGLAHAFVRIEAKDKQLTNIDLLERFVHVRYVDLSNNFLRDISPLSALTHMLVLKVENNKLTSAKLDELPYLQVANFNGNRISSTEGLNHPQLEHLSLNNNKLTEITDLDPGTLARLHTLELRGNLLKTTDGIFLPNLKNLFLAANQIKEVIGLERLEHLATLHLRGNQIEKLEGFNEMMANLQYLNLRENNITDMKEAKKLQCLPKLRALVLRDNPCSSEDEYRLEVLIALRRIERLDKDEYNDDERQEAEEIYEQRRQEELAAENQEEVIASEPEE